MRALGLCLFAAMLVAPTAAAAETRNDVYNGATCTPYPAFDPAGATPYSYWLYGFKQGAFCHFTMPDGWRVRDLSYVLFSGTVSGATPVRVRLCVYVSGSSATCGTERTLTSSMSVNWVAPPAVPTYASGAYLMVNFPTGISVFRQFIPVWTR